VGGGVAVVGVVDGGLDGFREGQQTLRVALLPLAEAHELGDVDARPAGLLVADDGQGAVDVGVGLALLVLDDGGAEGDAHRPRGRGGRWRRW